jgi:competence protein ComEA
MMGSRRRAGVRALAGLAALAAIALGMPALAADTAPTGTVNVNTATLEELQLLPGVGESRARAVIEARKQRGGFKSVDDLLEVKGIGAASLEKLRPYVTVEGKTTARAE